MMVKPEPLATEAVWVSCKAAESVPAEAATREMPAPEVRGAALISEPTPGEATTEARATDGSAAHASTGEPSGATTRETAARVSTAEPSSTVP